jgi:hypothetical protein
LEVRRANDIAVVVALPAVVVGMTFALDIWRSGPHASDPHRVSLYVEGPQMANFQTTRRRTVSR